MKNKTKIILTSTLASIPVLSISSACIYVYVHNNKVQYFNTLLNNKYVPENLNNQKYIDIQKYVDELITPFKEYDLVQASKDLGTYYSKEWFDSLSSGNWNYKNPGDKVPENLYCNSAKQAVGLYAVEWGDFWNVALHKQQTPVDTEIESQSFFPNNKLKVRGNDYKLIQQALQKSSLKENTVVYHGVEFMENEFYDQLKQFIKQDNNNNYDYSDCVGKEITSYGFLSTSLDKAKSKDYSVGEDWTDNGTLKPPLKSPFCFKIFIPKNIKGAGYISYFDFIDGVQNYEDQIMINKDSTFKIINYYKEGDVNFFDLILLDTKIVQN